MYFCRRNILIDNFTDGFFSDIISDIGYKVILYHSNHSKALNCITLVKEYIFSPFSNKVTRAFCAHTTDVFILFSSELLRRRKYFFSSGNMSKLCAAPKCDRTLRAPCDCCGQNLCLQHLHEHNTILVSKLNPLTDEINVLGDRLNRLNIQQTLGECREKLEQWRLDCYRKIDRLFEQKCQELDQIIINKTEKQREKILHIQSKIDKLIRDQETTQEDIDILTSTVRHLENEMNKIEEAHVSVMSRPLLIDESTVQVKEIFEKEFDASAISTVCKTIAYPLGSWRSLATNGRLLLIHLAPDLCFVNAELTVIKQVLWPHGGINDICWSSTLDQFIVAVKDNIFLVDKNTMSIKSIETVGNRNWLTCTCFNEQLFLSENKWGSTIIEVSLPSFTITKEWKPPITCTMDENILNTVYNNGTLVIVIINKVEESIRMELRPCTTLDCIWSLTLDTVYKNMKLCCCSLTCDEWLMADHNTGRLLHITADGKMKETIPYEAIPYHVTVFSSSTLVIATEKEINFHKLL